MSRLHEALRKAAEEQEKKAAERQESPPSCEGRDHLDVPAGNPAPLPDKQIDAETLLATRAEWHLHRPKARLSAVFEFPYGLTVNLKPTRQKWIAACLLLATLAITIAYLESARVTRLLPRHTIASVVFEGTMRPETEFSIAAMGPGTVRMIAVQVGESVREGQILAALDDQEAKLALREAELKQEVASQKLANLRAQLAQVQAGLATAERTAVQVPSRQWRDSTVRAQAVYEQASVKYKRAEELFRSGIIAKQELQERATELRVAEDDLSNAQNLANASASVAQRQQKEAALQAEIGRLEELREVREATFRVDAARTRLDSTELRATRSGIIAAIPVKVGDQVAAGTPVIKLARLDEIVVEVPVGPALVQTLHAGQKAIVTLPSLPEREVEGRVKLVNPLPGANMTFIVEVAFQNPTAELLAGQPAQVRFP